MHNSSDESILNVFSTFFNRVFYFLIIPYTYQQILTFNFYWFWFSLSCYHHQQGRSTRRFYVAKTFSCFLVKLRKLRNTSPEGKGGRFNVHWSVSVVVAHSSKSLFGEHSANSISVLLTALLYSCILFIDRRPTLFWYDETFSCLNDLIFIPIQWLVVVNGLCRLPSNWEWLELQPYL